MTLQDRCDAYAKAYPDWPASWPRIGFEQGRQVMYATWLIGNDYRNPSKYYGAYPKGYVDRIMSMWPDAGGDVLHAFSGSLQAGNYVRCDLVQAAELNCSVYDIAQHTSRRFKLLAADPPYTSEDAKKYGTAMISRAKATRGLAGVAEQGAHMVWLDTVWPMHSKTQWVTVGRITIVRSTNHRVRLATVFERVGGAG